MALGISADTSSSDAIGNGGTDSGPGSGPNAGPVCVRPIDLVHLARYTMGNKALEREILDADLLAQAIKATFERRGMTVPAELPVGLTDEFAHDASRQVLWQSFVKKNELDPEPLAAIVGRLRLALEPALNRAAR